MARSTTWSAGSADVAVSSAMPAAPSHRELLSAWRNAQQRSSHRTDEADAALATHVIAPLARAISQPVAAEAVDAPAVRAAALAHDQALTAESAVHQLDLRLLLPRLLRPPLRSAAPRLARHRALARPRARLAWPMKSKTMLPDATSSNAAPESTCLCL